MPTKKLVDQDLYFGLMVYDLIILDYEKDFRNYITGIFSVEFC